MLSDYKSALTLAQWSEASMQERREAIALAKSIEQALSDSTLHRPHDMAFASHRFCLCPPALSLSPPPASTLHPHSTSTLPLSSLPTLSGRRLGKRSHHIFASSDNEEGMHAFMQALAHTRATLAACVCTLTPQSYARARTLGVADRIAVVPKEKEWQAQQQCNLLLVPACTILPLSAYQPLLQAAASNARPKDEASYIPVAATHATPASLASLQLFTQPTDAAPLQYAHMLEDAVTISPTRRRLQHATAALLRTPWDADAAARTLSTFIRGAVQTHDAAASLSY